MASPALKQLKKVLSPRTPLMRLKSPFKGKSHALTKYPKAERPCYSPYFTPKPKKLFPDENVLTIKVPKETHILTLDPNINSFLEKGVNEKNVFILGKGSFGTVILSKLKEKNVALKIVKNNLEQCTMTREMNALILSHPNIVDVIQVIHNQKKPYGIVVMEAWSPLTLQAAIDDTINIRFEDSIRLFIGIVEALDYCHQVGIVHLDVKPKNILIELKSMQSKLCDFGNSNNIRITSPFPHIQGTVAYIAPELLKGKCVTEKCDVYSFGITMWQMLHKENPYRGIESHVIIYQVVSNHFRPQTSSHKSEVKGFVKLYERCWQEDPSERPSISAVGSALQSML